MVAQPPLRHPRRRPSEARVDDSRRRRAPPSGTPGEHGWSGDTSARRGTGGAPARRAWQIYLVAGAALLALPIVYPRWGGDDSVVNLLGLASTAAMLAGARINRPDNATPWYLFAVGHALFVAADVFRASFLQALGAEASFPSSGDLFRLAAYPALICGVLVLIRERNPSGRDRGGLIDALIITTGVALLMWVFVMAPLARAADLAVLEKAVILGHPFMDLLLLAVTVRLSVDNGARRPTLYLLVGGILTLLVTEVVHGFVSLTPASEMAGLFDTGWAVYYLLWGAAALHPSMSTLADPAPNRETRLTRARLALLTVASLVAPAVRMVQILRGEPIDEWILIPATVALFGLVVARMAGLLRDRERSAAREKALRKAGQALVAATGRDEVYVAALESMASVAGPEHRARLCVYGGDGRVSVRATAPGSAAVVRRWDVERSALALPDDAPARTPTEIDVAGSGLVAALRLPPDTTKVLALPLVAQGKIAGTAALAGRGSFSPELQYALQTLASKVTLALESAALSEDLHHRRSEARFQSLVQNSSDVITVIGADSTIRYQSPSVERVLGYAPDELAGVKLVALLHPHEKERVLNVLAERLDGDEADAVECRLRHRNGSWLYFEILRTNLLHDPNVGGIVLNGRNVSERKAFEDQLTHQAFHDPLTNLANRALFSDRVQHALARQARESSSLAVMFIDLDDFKTINDSLGHAPGDHVLAEVAARMNACMRPMDTLARFGGDEFAVLLEDVGEPNTVAEVADRILKALEAPLNVGDQELFVGASMGITIVRGDEAMTARADELMRNADVAMYMAKRDGKGNYRLYEPEMHAGVLERLELKGDLQRAIEHGELELHYQPVVDLETRAVGGLEALVRWNHPRRGVIAPREFIPLAEETGLIVPLGRWVLFEACRHAVLVQGSHPARRPLTMSVNLSIRQLQHHGLVGHVDEALKRSGLDPSCLTLEITESMLMSDAEMTIARLSELKALGVCLAVDDFGTGYSSLSHLSQFPVDILKIDQAFIRPVTDGAEESALAAAIVKLGEALHLTTVAEGIENPEQMERLIELGCEVGQGFYFAAPMDLKTILEYLGAAGRTSQLVSHGRDSQRSV